MISFSEFTDKEVNKEITAAHKNAADDYSLNKQMFTGDHWRSGGGWAGPLPSDAAEKQKALTKIKALFVSQNVVKEVVERHCDGVLSRDPEWSFTITREIGEDDKPEENEKELIDELEAAMTVWWKTKGGRESLYDWATQVLLGKRAVLRLYIPKSSVEGGKLPKGELAENLRKIRVEVIDPDKGVVIEHNETGKLGGMVKYKNDDDDDVYEITFEDESGQTVIKQVGVEGEFTGNLGGRITMYEGAGDLFITEQIRRKNDVVNKAHSMLNGNLDSGFLERVFLNAQPPGKWVPQEDGTEKFVPSPIQVGSGTTNFLSGIEYNTVEDEESGEVRKNITTPSVEFREPVPSDTFTNSKAHAYEAILEECKQKHALISGDSTPSGESRIQALSDFIASISKTKSQVDEAGSWLIETVAALALDIAGRTTDMEKVRADFSCRLNAGSLPAALRAEITNQVDKGLLSKESAMSMLGVDDVDAEIAKIDTATIHVKEVLDICERVQIKPPTLIQALYKKVIADKDILSDLEPSSITAIENEIKQILDREAQERTFLTGAGIEEN